MKDPKDETILNHEIALNQVVQLVSHHLGISPENVIGEIAIRVAEIKQRMSPEDKERIFDENVAVFDRLVDYAQSRLAETPKSSIEKKWSTKKRPQLRKQSRQKKSKLRRVK